MSNGARERVARSCPALAVLEQHAMGGAAEASLEEHLSRCAPCRALLREMRENVSTLERLRRATQPREAVAGAADLLPGYRIGEELKRGSQGVVYRGVQLGTGRSVAVKMLLGGPWATERQRRRFEREIEAASLLRHPGIVTIYDSIQTPDGRFAYAMELVEGGVPLTQWRPASPLPLQAPASPREELRAKLRVFAGVCEAVHFAHQRAVIHRDLKPSNILVEPTGQARVLDFGIAKFASADAAQATMTGEFSGTLQYASPEQVSGSAEELDVRTDVFSLGVTLYEMVCGAVPYELGDSVARAVVSIQSAPPVPPSSRSALVDRDLETIILRSLEKDRARRYQSADALRRDVEHYLKDEPIEARRDSAWYVLFKTARRHRGALAAAAVVLLALVGGIAVAAYSVAEARVSKSREAYERTRAETGLAVSDVVTQLLDELIPPDDRTFEQTGQRARRIVDRLAANVDAGRYADKPHLEAAARVLLGEVYRKRGLLEEAELNFAVAVRLSRESMGPTHPDTLLAMDRLAGVKAELGQLARAKVLVAEVLEARRGAGDDVPTGDAETRTTLARILLQERDFAGAEAQARRAAAAQQAALGDVAPGLADSREALARALLGESQGPDAVSAAKEALRTRFRTQTDNHPDVLRNIRFIRQMCEQLGLADDAQAYRSAEAAFSLSLDAPAEAPLWAVGSVRSDVFHFDGPDVAPPVLERGLMHMGLQEYDAAAKTFAAAEIYLERGPDTPPMAFANCHAHLAAALEQLGDLDAALKLMEDRRKILVEELQLTDCLATTRTQAQCATLLARLGHLEEAEREFRACERSRADAIASDEALRRAVALRHAGVLLALGRFDEVGAVFQPREVVAVPGAPQNSDELAAEERLVRAGILALRGDRAGAREWFLEHPEQFRPLMASWGMYRTLVERLLAIYRQAGDEESAGALQALLWEPLKLIEGYLEVRRYK